MGKIICTITSWWQQQKEDIKDFIHTLYIFYTAPLEGEYVPVQEYTPEMIQHMQEQIRT